jgi:hypothetical protein
MSDVYISLMQKTSRRTCNLVVVTTVVRPIGKVGRITLSTNFDGLAIVIIIVVSLDISEVPFTYLRLSRGLEKRHFKTRN